MSQELTFTDKRGSQFTINLCGATVVSWKNCDEEILFCSEKAVRDGSKAIRGGIPLVFPNFGAWELGPSHGFARIKPWKLSAESKEAEDPSWTFTLEDDEETRKMWNFRFRLDYTVQLLADSLKTSLQVTNTGDATFTFTALMHTYFRVKNIADVRIRGLQNLKFADKVNGGDHTETRELVDINENVDRVYRDSKNPVIVYPDGNQGSSTYREITASNFPDIVVWNPWIEKARAMSDLGEEGYPYMVCVEPGAVSEPVSLDAKCDITFSQTIKVGNKSKI